MVGAFAQRKRVLLFRGEITVGIIGPAFNDKLAISKPDNIGLQAFFGEPEHLSVDLM